MEAVVQTPSMKLIMFLRLPPEVLEVVVSLVMQQSQTAKRSASY